MSHIHKSLIVAILLLGAAMQVHASSVLFNFSFDAGADGKGFGYIYATPNGDGTYTGTGGSLTVATGTAAGTYALDTTGTPTTPAGTYNSQSNAFQYDNVLTPSLAWLIDGWGLVFRNAGSGREAYFASDLATPDQYVFMVANALGDTIVGTGDPNSSFKIPEPVTVALFAIGLLGMFASQRGRARMAA